MLYHLLYTTPSIVALTRAADGEGALLLYSHGPWALAIATVGTVMHTVYGYSIQYMLHEAHSTLFLLHVLLFMVAMLLYMHMASTLHLLVGWEYLGLLSYLLIQHWGPRPLAILGSAKALMYNRGTDTAVVLYTSVG